MENEDAIIARQQSQVSLAQHSAVSRTTVGTKSTGAIVVDFNEGVPQLTLKACIAGLISGTVCTFMALYYGLKVGITPSLNILGGVLGYSLAKVMTKIPGFKEQFTPQENAVIQTFSVAIYSVACPGMGFASGWLGLNQKTYEITHLEYDRPEDVVDLSYWRSAVWAMSMALFGFFIAYPVRNYYLIKKRLLFPSGTATAYVIHTLHASKHQAKIGMSLLGKYFSIAFLVNMTVWFYNGLDSFPVFGMSAAHWNWYLDWDLGSVGIGMLLGLNINLSMLLGALLVAGIINPAIDKYRDGAHDWVNPDDEWYNSNTLESPYVGNYAYGLFVGLALMLVQGAWAVCEMIVVVVLANLKKTEPEQIDDPFEEKRIEIFTRKGYPIWASILGYCVFGAGTIVIHAILLDTKWYQTLIAIAVIPLMAIANLEGMGRTDWDVSSAYGKLIMFPIGAVNDSIIPAVTICHTTISGCSNAALLMQDFKTGYILGADPTTMFLAQVIGIVLGCFITPALFALFLAAWDLPVDYITNPDAFVTGRFGPIYRTLAVVATQGGWDALPAGCLWLSLGAAMFALVICLGTTLADIYVPGLSPWIPNISGVSIGALIGPTVGLQFTVGSLIVWYWARFHSGRAMFEKNYAASGLVAGSGFAVALQVICALGDFAPAVEVKFSAPPGHSMSTAAWVLAVLCLIAVLVVFSVGAYVWHRIPDGDLTDLLGDDDEADDQLDLEDVQSIKSTNSARGKDKSQ